MQDDESEDSPGNKSKQAICFKDSNRKINETATVSARHKTGYHDLLQAVMTQPRRRTGVADRDKKLNKSGVGSQFVKQNSLEPEPDYSRVNVSEAEVFIDTKMIERRNTFGFSFGTPLANM